MYSYNYVSNQRKIVKFCWIPSHIGIHGNSKDKAAKSALKFEIVKFKIPSTDKLSNSDGTLNGVPWHAKDRFTGFRSRLVMGAGETSKFLN